MPKITYPDLQSVPEVFAENATQNDAGEYTIDVELSSKIREFRDNNVTLQKKTTELVTQLSAYETATDVTLAQIAEGKLDDYVSSITALRETAQKVEDGDLVASTSLQEAMERRTAELQNGFKDQLATMAKERDVQKIAADKAVGRANDMVVENLIRAAATRPEVGMQEGSVSLVLDKAKDLFKVTDNGITPKNKEGVTVTGPDGITDLTPTEWLMQQRKDFPFLFKGSSGGGAAGGKDTIGNGMTLEALNKMSITARMTYFRNMQNG